MMKRTGIRQVPLIAAAVLLALGLTVLLMFSVQALLFKAEQNIGAIEVTTQNMGGATTINYQPVLAEGVDWAHLSSREREDTARYAVEAAIAQAQEDKSTSYNVLGLSQSRQPLFLYTGGEFFTLFVEDQTLQVSLDE